MYYYTLYLIHMMQDMIFNSTKLLTAILI